MGVVTGLRAKLAEQPQGVFLLFCTELWERFSYYGMLGLLVLFLVAPASTGGFGWDNTSALRVFGTFLGLIWFAPLIGGWAADRLMGARWAVVLGCMSLALGNFLLASCALVQASADPWLRECLLYAGLAGMVVGAGLFKSNVSVLMGSLFPNQEDPRRDFGFTIFYMGINLGALLAPLIAGTLGERVGWHWGFGISGIGMLIGITIFLAVHRRLLKGGDAPIHRNRTEQNMDRRPDDAKRIATIGIFAVFATVFATGLMQYGGLLNLFTAQAIDRTVAGFDVPATWFLTLNPLYIILFGPVVAAAWDARVRRGAAASSADKFLMALVLMVLAFALIAWVAMSSATEAPGHWGAIVVFYLVFTVGELCLYPVGLALVSKIAPPRLIGILMGAWLLTNAVGSWIAGGLGVLAQRVGNATVFASLAAVAAIAAAILCGLRRSLTARTENLPQ